MPASSSNVMNTPFGIGEHDLRDLFFGMLLVRARWRLFPPAGFQVGRADRVDGDVGVGGFQCQHLGKAQQAVLGRDIGALVAAADQRVSSRC